VKLGLSSPREDHRLRVSENKVVRRRDLRKRKLEKYGENYIIRNFIICNLYLILLG
jgi:hypothetical protein